MQISHIIYKRVVSVLTTWAWLRCLFLFLLMQTFLLTLSERPYENRTCVMGDNCVSNSPGPGWSLGKPQSSGEIEHLASVSIFRLLLPEVHFKFEAFMLKPHWEEWLHAAKHIWAHLVWIAHWETWMAECLSQTVPVSESLVLVLQPRSFSFRETTR